MNKFFEDFGNFIAKGNVIDLAVAVIIGAAFKPVISSLVADVIMPPIGLALGNVDFSELKFIIQEATIGASEIAIRYGVFIQKLVDFVIIGFCVFLVVKAYNKLQELKKKEEEEAPDPGPGKEEALLIEIRDILKTSQEAVNPKAVSKN